MNKKSPVEKQHIIGEVIKSYPESAIIMLEFGLNCVGCFANKFETIEAGAKVHGMKDEDIEKMLKKINKNIKTD